MAALPATLPRIIDGRYAVLRRLGAGSAGSVYEAEQLSDGERVAIKVLSPALACVPAVRARFVAEGRAAARIAHENVVGVRELGVGADGTPYIVMELALGDTLEQLLEAEGTIAVSTACELMLQVLAGLSAAHASGIVHRDLKPANVLVAWDREQRPQVKVIDFGIAQGLLEREADGVASGALLGTPAYMAPEQALGRIVDARADVYAVAAMLYELVAGRRVFDGGDPNHVLSRVVCGDFIPLRALRPELPEALLSAVDAGLELDPELRISSDELARALASLARAERPSSGGSIGISSRAPIPSRPAALSHAELTDPQFPRLRAAPFDADALDALGPGEARLTPSERVRRRATTLPAEAPAPPRPELSRAELWVVLGGFAAGVLLSWASTGF